MKRTSACRRPIRISAMTTHPSSAKKPSTRSPVVSVFLALVASAVACGDLDERDTDPPSVKALTIWDSGHLLALRTYHQNAAILDGQTGQQTGELLLGRYYEDIELVGPGVFVAAHNQWLEFLDAQGRVDGSRSVQGTVFGGIALSADRSTLVYSDYRAPTEASIHVASLRPGVERISPLGTYNNANRSLSDAFALSRNGDLVAVLAGDVGLARTLAPASLPSAEAPAVSTCALTQGTSSWQAAGTVTFSPVADTLAVGSTSGQVELFDVSNYPECRSLLVIPSLDGGIVGFLRYSPDGSRLALSKLITARRDDVGVTTFRAIISVFDATTGTLLRDLLAHQWEMPDQHSRESALTSDLLWSEDGTRLTVSSWGGPVQQWDIATGGLRWETKL